MATMSLILKGVQCTRNTSQFTRHYNGKHRIEHLWCHTSEYCHLAYGPNNKPKPREEKPIHFYDEMIEELMIHMTPSEKALLLAKLVDD